MSEGFGEPRRNPFLTESGRSPEIPHAPEYLVYLVQWADVDPKYITGDCSVIDFGQAFRMVNPPEDLGIPGPYRSPELLLDHAVSVGCDLWALGCTLFTIRTGRPLFNLFDNEDDAYLEAMVEILGKMPEPWWSTTWKSRKSLFEDETDDSGRAIPLRKLSAPDKTRDYQVSIPPSVADGARSLQDMLEPGVWYMEEGSAPGASHREIPEEEKVAFADLLSQVLVFDIHKRRKAEDIAEHPWFKYKALPLESPSPLHSRLTR